MATSGPRRREYLHPGRVLVCEQPTVVTTVLGSCVSVTLYARRLRVGAICHAVLPTGNRDLPGSPGFRYLDRALGFMLEAMRSRRMSPGELEIKAFGGADLPRETSAPPTLAPGRENVRAVLRAVDELGGRLASWDFSGPRGRKLHFVSDTGDVWVRSLGDHRDPGCRPGPFEKTSSRGLELAMGG